MDAQVLKDRTKAFALGIIRLCREQNERDLVVSVLTKQLLRAGTSVGANYRAACLAKSKADMASKLKTVEEEADECMYWLELLTDAGGNGDLAGLAREADELRRIASASVKTLRADPKA